MFLKTNKSAFSLEAKKQHLPISCNAFTSRYIRYTHLILENIKSQPKHLPRRPTKNIRRKKIKHETTYRHAEAPPYNNAFTIYNLQQHICMERFAGGEFRRLKVSAFSLDHLFEGDDDVARELQENL